VFSRSVAANSLSIIKTATRKISGRPPPTIPTAILIESGSAMRMAWQKMSINLSMSFLPAKLNARPNLTYAQRAKKRRSMATNGRRLPRALMSAIGTSGHRRTNSVGPLSGVKRTLPKTVGKAAFQERAVAAVEAAAAAEPL
jgi:hypothetical protein